MKEIYVSIHEHELFIREVEKSPSSGFWVGKQEVYDVDPIPVGVTVWLNILEKIRAS
jgi:hypothetical protein